MTRVQAGGRQLNYRNSILACVKIVGYIVYRCELYQNDQLAFTHATSVSSRLSA